MKTALYIFTKDRPNTLQKLIKAVAPSGVQSVVIDDSVYSQLTNSALCQDYDMIYFGVEQQRKLARELGSDSHLFLKPLGSTDWNLGFSRNYALCHAKMNNLKKVLFLDDDLVIEDASLITQLFSNIRSNVMVGAKITGMEDDSILGHIASSLKISYERMLSGGCLGFYTDNINSHFLNLYNEDWIWQYFQSDFITMEWHGSIKQELYNPFENFENKILFQELGEYYIDGIQEALQKKDFSFLEKEQLWYDVAQKRKAHLNTILDSCHENISFYNIVDWLLKNYSLPSANTMAKKYLKYQSDKKTFNLLFPLD